MEVRSTWNSIVMVQILSSYQVTEFNNTSLSLQIISCGVPQGSILSPLLFFIYVNDISDVSKVLHVILFAVDSNILFLSGADPDSFFWGRIYCE